MGKRYGAYNITATAYDNASNSAVSNSSVTVVIPVNITSFAPPLPVNDAVCNGRTFNVTVNVSWYLNNSLLHTNESIQEANYTLHAEFVGDNNVSAIAKNANGTDMQTWIWDVSSAPVPVPEFNVIGLLAFICVSSVVLAVAMLRKRR